MNYCQYEYILLKALNSLKFVIYLDLLALSALVSLITLQNNNKSRCLMSDWLHPGRMAIIIVLVSGVLGTFAYKLMSSQHVQEGGHERYFFHPYMETLTMTIGELLCLALYYLNIKSYRLPLQEGKTPHRFYIFVIPGLCDASLSIMQYMALNFISGSTYRILVGASIVTTLLFSKILLKIRIEKRQILGCGMGVLGLLLVGFSGLIESSQSQSSDFSLQMLGYLLMIGSLFISGFLYSYEQLLMQRHTIHPLECVGWQGFFGFSVVLTASIVLTFIPCSFGQDLCVYDNTGNMYFERFDLFFKEICTNWVLGLLVVIAILTVSASNTSGVAITKYYDGLTRCLVVMSKTAGVWIIGLIVSFSVGDNPDYQLESKSLAVNLVKAGGFFCIILGTLVYNKLILGDCMSQQVNQAIEQQKQIKKDLLQSQKAQ